MEGGEGKECRKSNETPDKKELEWLRRNKWVGFYDGSHAPHAPPADLDPVDALPWRTSQSTSQLRDYISRKDRPRIHRAIELGCGTGENLILLAESGCDTVVGVDIAEVAVERSKQNIGRLRSSDDATATATATAVCADILDPSQLFQRLEEVNPEGGAGSFDFLFDCQTFHCVRSVDEAVAKDVYASLLAPGGIALVLTGNADEPEERGPVRLTRDEVLHMFDDTALECEHLEAARFDPTPHYERQKEHDLPPLAWVSRWRKKGAVLAAAAEEDTGKHGPGPEPDSRPTATAHAAATGPATCAPEDPADPNPKRQKTLKK